MASGDPHQVRTVLANGAARQGVVNRDRLAALVAEGIDLVKGAGQHSCQSCAHIQQAKENEERALAAAAGPTTCDGQNPS